MTDPLAPTAVDGTDLTEEEKEGLIPTYIATRAELNEAEQENILEARTWAFDRRRGDILGGNFLDTLHKRMYGKVWRWAGTHRRSGKNIGIDWHDITTELRKLGDNCCYWIEHNTYPIDEIAARFHHGLTFIHCYPNGNGRHARMAADLLLTQLGKEPFSWGNANLADAGKTRDRYIAALHAADKHDIGPLLDFVRS